MSVLFQRLHADRPAGEGEPRALRLAVPDGDEEKVALSGALGDWFWIGGSADGRRIAQVRYRGGRASLWVASSDDPAAMQRIAHADDGIRSVLWSHDRSTIFFTTIEMRGEQQVRERFWRVAAAAGSKPRLLATLAADGEYGQHDLHAITPDGRTIVWIGAAHEGAGGTYDAGTLATRSGKISTFDRPVRTICGGEAAVTADASTLVYVRADRELVARSVSTQRESVLYRARRQALESVILSPDGQGAMVSDTDTPCTGPEGEKRITDVVAVGVIESGNRRIHRARDDERLDARAWSPDGRWVWLSSSAVPGTSAMYDNADDRIRSFGGHERKTSRTFLAWLVT